MRWIFGLFIPFLLDRVYIEVFRIWPVNFQGRARFCPFGVVGEFDKHAYALSPTAHNAFFLASEVQEKNSNVFFNGKYCI